jgi:hypothetical protein
MQTERITPLTRNSVEMDSSTDASVTIQTKVEERCTSEAGTFDEILDSLTVISSHIDTECPMPDLDMNVLTPLEQELFPIICRLWEHACLVPFTQRDPSMQMTAERAGQWRRRVTEKARSKQVSHIPPTRGIHPLHRLIDKLIFGQLFRPHVRGENVPPVDAHAVFEAVLRSRTIEVPHVYMGKSQGRTLRGTAAKKVKKREKTNKRSKKCDEDVSETDSTLTDSSVEAIVRGPSIEPDLSTRHSVTSSSSTTQPQQLSLPGCTSTFVARPFGVACAPSDFLDCLREHHEVLRYLMSLGAESALDLLESRRRYRTHRSKYFVLLLLCCIQLAQEGACMILTLFMVRFDRRVRHVPKEGTALVKRDSLFDEGSRPSTS